jgi:3-oxoacyl-(acyl-carrier-protein) synthase
VLGTAACVVLKSTLPPGGARVSWVPGTARHLVWLLSHLLPHLCEAPAGKSGITAIEKWDTEEMSTKFAGEIKELDCKGYVSAKMERRLDPYIKYTMVAAKKALEYSGLGACDVALSR